MNRRGFLQAILAAGVAPAFVGSGILMPIRKLIAPSGTPVEVGYRLGGDMPYGAVVRLYSGPRGGNAAVLVAEWHHGNLFPPAVRQFTQPVQIPDGGFDDLRLRFSAGDGPAAEVQVWPSRRR